MGRSTKTNEKSFIINEDKIEKILAYKDKINEIAKEHAKDGWHELNNVYEKHKDIVNCIELSNQIGISFWDLMKYGVVERKTLAPFYYTFSEKQLNVIADIFNDYISAMPFQITTNQMRTIFNTQEYIGFIRVKKNRVLSFLFDELAQKGLVCSNWQEVIEKNKLFASRMGKIIKAKDLSAALSRYKNDELQRAFIRKPMIEPYRTIREIISTL